MFLEALTGQGDEDPRMHMVWSQEPVYRARKVLLEALGLENHQLPQTQPYKAPQTRWLKYLDQGLRRLFSAEASPLALQVAAFSLCLHGAFSLCVYNPISSPYIGLGSTHMTSSSTSLQTLSPNSTFSGPGGLGLQHMDLGIGDTNLSIPCTSADNCINS